MDLIDKYLGEKTPWESGSDPQQLASKAINYYRKGKSEKWIAKKMGLTTSGVEELLYKEKTGKLKQLPKG